MAHDFLIPVNDTDSAIGGGWFIEADGRRVAELIEPMYQSGSQFWYSYVVKPLIDDPQEKARLLTSEFWHTGKLVFRSRKFGAVAPNAFAALAPPDSETHRIAVRGLYLELSPGLSLI